MGTKHQKLEKPDQIVCSLKEEHVSTHSKSYICSFCKRGFSNAQALGGHMNIHRRERAKLRESSDQQLLSSDNVKATDMTVDQVEDRNRIGNSPRTGTNTELYVYGSSSCIELDLELRLGSDSK